ncbi:substrate-binding domain-containing protein [Candidatus Sumerlaeota bacterium]|nr:substrate-binding domain-containing protein [Candidatus Sumerlaeota bacterium]
MNEKPRVAVFVNPAASKESNFFDGVVRFAEPRDWRIVTGGEVQRRPRSALSRWPGHGVVGFLRDADLATALKRVRIPTVNTSQRGVRFGLQNVLPSFEDAGRTAAQFFLERGFQRFVFTHEGVLDRYAGKYGGFRGRLAESGHSCSIIRQQDPRLGNRTWAQCQRTLISQLRRLPKPVAIWAGNDAAAVRVLEACEEAGLPVPKDVAVVGQGNERALCRYTRPELTSIDFDFESFGFIAAGVLEQLMAGGPPPAEPVLPPWRLVERGSAETICGSDPQLAEALSYIEAHACDPVWVEGVARHVGMGRRNLERLFRQHLLRSPNTEIVRVRVRRARQMLAETALPLTEIAVACGFSGPRGLRDAFRRLTGATPRTYRSQNRETPMRIERPERTEVSPSPRA